MIVVGFFWTFDCRHVNVTVPMLLSLFLSLFYHSTPFSAILNFDGGYSSKHKCRTRVFQVRGNRAPDTCGVLTFGVSGSGSEVQLGVVGRERCHVVCHVVVATK